MLSHRRLTIATDSKGGHMYICEWCNQAWGSADGCTKETDVFIDGTIRRRRPATFWGCDCGVTRGKMHHPGCDLDYCAICNDQALYCECSLESIIDTATNN
jgi:hypothetical protein